MDRAYDGWCLHTASTTLLEVMRTLDRVVRDPESVRVMAWVKPFASFKKHVAVAYAWEPVLVRPARKREFDGWSTVRDWCSESITLKRGLTGAKPERVCHWLFDAMGCLPDDDFEDLFPGSGAVTRAWESWLAQRTLFEPVRTLSGERSV